MIILALVALIQCEATLTYTGCKPIEYQPTLTTCKQHAREYQKFDNNALKATGLPAIVSYSCKTIQ